LEDLVVPELGFIGHIVEIDRKSTRLNSVTRPDLVCRLLLEKKKKTSQDTINLYYIT